MALFIIFAIATLGVAGYGIYKTYRLISSEMVDIDMKKTIMTTLLYDAIAAVCFTVMLVGGMIWGGYPCDALHWVKLIVGGLIFGFAFTTAINFFMLFYYGKNIDEKIKKTTYHGFMCLFVVSFLTLFLWLDGYAPYLEYPLINGISFENGWVTPKDGRPNIAFYAICILSGAILVYFMCDHFMYQEYGKHGILESTFFVAFPAGIIGARIWYCIGNNVPFEKWIEIWKGGLTILGGATMGILVGVLWFLWRNKKYSIWIAVDCIVPTILIAQAVGRFGNFFNCEVHGLECSVEYFKWLPEIIVNNMKWSDTVGSAAPGNMFVPLFFIEALVNFFGYFLIAHVFGKKFKKVLEPGDLCAAYIIWYGLTRVILEPFRHANYNMGENGYWSWIWSLLFVFLGTIAIVVNHYVRYAMKKKKNNYVVLKGDYKLGLIETICFVAVGFGLFIPGIMLMANNEFVQKVGFSNFNIGIMLGVLGVSVLFYASVSFIRFTEAKRV